MLGVVAALFGLVLAFMKVIAYQKYLDDIRWDRTKR